MSYPPPPGPPGPHQPSPFAQQPPAGWGDNPQHDDPFRPNGPLMVAPKKNKVWLPWALGLAVVLAAGVVITVVLVNNGTGGHSANAVPSSLSTNSTPAELKKYLLAKSDVPADWKEQPAAEKPDTNTPQADTAACTAAWTKVNGAKSAADVTTSFGPGGFATASTRITVNPVDVAKSWFTLMETTVEKCPTYTEDGIKLTYSNSFEPDTMGDQTDVYDIKGTQGSITLEEVDWICRSGGKIWTWSFEANSAGSGTFSQMKSISRSAIAKWRTAIG